LTAINEIRPTSEHKMKDYRPPRTVENRYESGSEDAVADALLTLVQQVHGVDKPPRFRVHPMSQYNVFISYSSQDRPWAERLRDSLAGHGLQVYFDRDSLRDGDGWEKQLEGGLKHADHLVCLWSQKACNSAWVNRELAQFRAKAPAAGGDAKLLIVQLDDRPNAYGSTQQIAVPALKEAYANAANPITDEAWGRLVDRLVAGVNHSTNTLEVPVALLTLTRDQAQTLTPDLRARLKRDLGLDDEALAARYGQDRLDWRPFGTTTTIRQVLEVARSDLNHWLTPQSIAWHLPGPTFWTEVKAARDFAARMASSRLGAVVIDPVAMLVVGLPGKLGHFDRCLHCENVAFIAVPPAPASAQEGLFHDWLGEFAPSTFERYFEPPLPDMQAPHARYGVGLGDVGQVRRLLQRSVGDHLRKGLRDGGPRNPITSFGAP